MFSVCVFCLRDRLTIMIGVNLRVISYVVSWVVLLSLAALATAQLPPRGDLRVLILSDFNGAYGSVDYAASVDRVIALAQTWQVDAFVSAGDVIAGQNRDLPAERFAQMWNAFDDHVRAPLGQAGIPLIVAMGNHDGSSQRSQNNYVFARERDAARNYWQPISTSAHYLDRRDAPFHTSLLVNDVFFAVWDASSAMITEGQLEWLATELSRPEVVNARARILVGHLPLFGVAASKNQPGEVLNNGAALATWLSRSGIDLYISGHHAAYYPAQYGDMYLLHTGGVGGRQLIGSDAPARSTATLLDVDFDTTERTTIRETTFDLATMMMIDPRTLPASITSVNGTVRRWPE
jgi:predicted phosphodiesterase